MKPSGLSSEPFGPLYEPRGEHFTGVHWPPRRLQERPVEQPTAQVEGILGAADRELHSDGELQ